MRGTGLLLQHGPESFRYLISECLVYLVCFVYTFMIITGIKRAHDMGYSAWGAILLSLLPILLFLPGVKQDNEHGPIPTRWI